MADAWVRDGDTGPSVRTNVRSPNEDTGELENTNLEGAESVLIWLWEIRGTTILLEGADMDILDEETGFVEYVWTEGEPQQGGYWGFIRVTFADGTEVSFPNDRFLTVAVTPDHVAVGS